MKQLGGIAGFDHNFSTKLHKITKRSLIYLRFSL
jgi:hypothetical protein